MATGGLYGASSTTTITYFEWFVFQQASSAPATPTGGSWNFTTNVGIPPTGWSNTVPSTLTNFTYVSIAFVDSRYPTTLVWSTPGVLGTQGPTGATGATGPTGATGATGAAATLNVGSTTTGAAGSSASVTNSGSTSAAVFNFTIPQGSAGAAATVAVGTTTTGAAGTSASVTNSGSSSAAVFDFTIPRGDTGATGPGVPTGGTTGQVLTKSSATNYDTSWTTITGTLSYQGTWNASTNSPTLTSSVGTNGYYYVVSTSGSTNLNGVTDWVTGDWAIFNGSVWQKLDQTNLVTSVNGQTGAVSVGTVTSVAATVPAFLSVAGSPITTSGTLALTYSGTALPVANGGTGVTTSSGANSVVLRDASVNISANAVSEGFSNVAAAGTTTTLTVASVPNYVVTGSGGQTYKLPDATTLANGANYVFNNNQSSGTIVVQNNSSTTVATIQSGGFVEVILLSNATAAGSWDVHNFAPSNVSWSTNTFDYAGSITSATWNGTAVAINRGGTGQATASAAFNALSPVTTTGDLIVGNGTNSATRLAIGTNGYVLTSNGTTATWAASTGGVTSFSAGTTGLTPSTGTTGAITLAGTLAVANGGTGVTTSTGSGNTVLSTSPTLVTPVLGTPTSVTLTNGTGLPISTGVSGLGTGVATALAVNVGTAGSPLVNGDVLGTPSSGTLTNATGLPLTTGVTGTLPIANGGTGQTTANTAFNALAPSQTSNSGKYLTTDGTNSSWATITAGASISNDTTTSTNLYPLFAAATSGVPTTIYTGNTKYLYKPSTGELSAPAPIATNGIAVMSTTVGSSYTIATGNNGFSVGPLTISSGVTVTVSSGQRHVII